MTKLLWRIIRFVLSGPLRARNTRSLLKTLPGLNLISTHRLLSGPLGIGKSMLAKRLGTILPPLTLSVHRGRREVQRIETQGYSDLRNPEAKASVWLTRDDERLGEDCLTLAVLLSVLAAEHGVPGADHLVGWKSKSDIAEVMEKRMSRSFDSHAISQMISRLRTELFKRGAVNPYLVQTSPRYGARFALRRKDGAWT